MQIGFKNNELKTNWYELGGAMSVCGAVACADEGAGVGRGCACEDVEERGGKVYTK